MSLPETNPNWAVGLAVCETLVLEKKLPRIVPRSVIAEACGVSRQRVEQIEIRALAKLARKLSHLKREFTS